MQVIRWLIMSTESLKNILVITILLHGAISHPRTPPFSNCATIPTRINPINGSGSAISSENFGASTSKATALKLIHYNSFLEFNTIFCESRPGNHLVLICVDLRI